MEIKTTVKFHHAPIRMAINNGGNQMEVRVLSNWNSHSYLWESYMAQSLRKNFLVISEKMKCMTQMFHSQVYTQKK